MVAASLAIHGEIDGTFTAGTATSTPAYDSDIETEQILLAVNLSARLHVDAPAVLPPTPVRRVMPGIFLDVPTPALGGGRPRLPRYWGRSGSEGTVIQGSGHARVFADPDPVWAGGAWVVAPPSAPVGANFVRWTARSLPDPADFAGNQYPLGAASSVDGTASIDADARHWAPADGSDLAINWDSAYPFKPVVRNHVHYGDDGSTVTHARGVRFRPYHVEHMWADFGTAIEMPFTVVMVAVITNFPSQKYRHFLLDSGRSPLPYVDTATRQAWRVDGVQGDTLLDEDFGYRTGLAVQRRQQWGWNDQNPTTRIARPPFANTLKPKMFFGIYNGAASYFGNYSDGPGRRSKKIGLADHGEQRLMVMGRRNSHLSPSFASQMVVFELRMWDKALTFAQLDGQFKQLSSTWRFHEYK